MDRTDVLNWFRYFVGRLTNNSFVYLSSIRASVRSICLLSMVRINRMANILNSETTLFSRFPFDCIVNFNERRCARTKDELQEHSMVRNKINYHRLPDTFSNETVDIIIWLIIKCRLRWQKTKNLEERGRTVVRLVPFVYSFSFIGGVIWERNLLKVIL